MAELNINVPQLLAILLITFLILRWVFSSSSWLGGSGAGPASAAAASSGNATGRTTRQARRTVNPAQIDQVAQMFPQLSRRDIAWDLQQNGGSVAATTERVLAGQAIPTAPPSYQLPPTLSSGPGPQGAGQSSVSTSSTASGSKGSHHYPDLITKYNLAAKLDLPDAKADAADRPAAGGPGTGPRIKTGPGTAWSQSKSERQQLLQKRREEMILSARRKLLERSQGTDRAGHG